jgi:hypothetical protein
MEGALPHRGNRIRLHGSRNRYHPRSGSSQGGREDRGVSRARCDAIRRWNASPRCMFRSASITLPHACTTEHPDSKHEHGDNGSRQSAVSSGDFGHGVLPFGCPLRRLPVHSAPIVTPGMTQITFGGRQPASLRHHGRAVRSARRCARAVNSAVARSARACACVSSSSRRATSPFNASTCARSAFANSAIGVLRGCSRGCSAAARTTSAVINTLDLPSFPG